MSLKIRLKEQNSQQSRIVLIDSRRSRDGKMLKQLGFINKAGKIYLDLEEFLFWLSQGAQASATILRIIDESGLLSLVDKIWQEKK